MTKLSKRIVKFATPALILLLACGTAGAASERVAMMSPAKDAAMVPFLAGMVNNLKAKTFMDEPRTVNDGIVIRQSRIENGKIIIPPGGLYVTSRSGNWEPFRGDVLTLAGKEYYAVWDRYERNVVRNITAKPGEFVPVNKQKTRGFQITSAGDSSLGMKGAGSSTFMLVKATGNYYGSSFPVQAGELLTNIAGNNLERGTKEPTGTTVPSAANGLDKMAYGSNFFSVGRTHVVIEPGNIDKTAIKVLEFATDSCSDLWVSPKAPVVGEYAKGNSFNIGSAKVEVSTITPNSVTVKVTDSKGSVEKVLGPYSKDKWLPMSMSLREPLWVLSKDGKTAVMLHVRKDGGPFAGSKVSLIAYTDIIHIQNSSVWPADNRFVAIPETWATCTYPHEVMLENAKEIVLDAKNNKYTGPEKQFTIVIDKFDGKAVQAWHIETPKGSTENLAERAKGKHIDAVVGETCRSTAHFFSRVYKDLFKEQNAKIAKMTK